MGTEVHLGLVIGTFTTLLVVFLFQAVDWKKKSNRSRKKSSNFKLFTNIPSSSYPYIRFNTILKSWLGKSTNVVNSN